MTPLPAEEADRWRSCTDCPLSETRSQVILSEEVTGGDPKGARLAIVDELPGDDYQSAFSRERYYQLSSLSELLLASACVCPPPEGREPTDDEILSCSGRLAREIECFSPDVVALIGDVARKAWREAILASPALGTLLTVEARVETETKRVAKEAAKIAKAAKEAMSYSAAPPDSGLVHVGWLTLHGARVEPLLIDAETGEMAPLRTEAK